MSNLLSKNHYEYSSSEAQTLFNKESVIARTSLPIKLLCSPWRGIWKGATLESCDLKYKLISDLRLKCVCLAFKSKNKTKQKTEFLGVLLSVICFVFDVNQNKWLILKRNSEESLVSSSLCNKERRAKVRDCESNNAILDMRKHGLLITSFPEPHHLVPLSLFWLFNSECLCFKLS